MGEFNNPKKTAKEMIDIISPLFNAGKTVKVGVGIQISLKTEDEVKQYLSEVLQFLIKEYKSK